MVNEALQRGRCLGERLDKQARNALISSQLAAHQMQCRINFETKYGAQRLQGWGIGCCLQTSNGRY